MKVLLYALRTLALVVLGITLIVPLLGGLAWYANWLAEKFLR